MTYFTCYGFPLFLAARTTFASSSYGPHPMPGGEIHSWKYALHCFCGMVFFCSLLNTVAYLIPTMLGAQVSLSKQSES